MGLESLNLCHLLASNWCVKLRLFVRLFLLELLCVRRRSFMMNVALKVIVSSSSVRSFSFWWNYLKLKALIFLFLGCLIPYQLLINFLELSTLLGITLKQYKYKRIFKLRKRHLFFIYNIVSLWPSDLRLTINWNREITNNIIMSMWFEILRTQNKPPNNSKSFFFFFFLFVCIYKIGNFIKVWFHKLRTWLFKLLCHKPDSFLL